MRMRMRREGVESPIPLQFFVTIFHHERPKHINTVKRKRCLHLTYFDIIDLTTMFNPMNQKPDILTWLIVMPVSAWATWPWHQLTIKFLILRSFGNSMGCWIPCWTRDFRVLPPNLNTPCTSIYGSILNILLFTSDFLCLLSKAISFPKYLLGTDLIIFIFAICIFLRPINFSLQVLCISGEGSLFVLTDLNNFCL